MSLNTLTLLALGGFVLALVPAGLPWLALAIVLTWAWVTK